MRPRVRPRVDAAYISRAGLCAAVVAVLGVEHEARERMTERAARRAGADVIVRAAPDDGAGWAVKKMVGSGLLPFGF